MKGIYTFVVKPKGGRYNNIKKIGDKELILNTEIAKHEFVNREAIVTALPLAIKTDIKVGDTVIVHHNVFRRWHNIKGEEKNSGSYYNEDTYILDEEQIFAYNSGDGWKPLKGYCFIQPLKETNLLLNEKEKLSGVVIYSDGTVEKNSLVSFKAVGKYEFVIDGERLYRVRSNKILIKYEYQGNEEKYNPGWAHSG
tara:strand:+ start:584 stop:1171 length:588 start_codon:yes stop_codon:yes gene_type:complete